MRGEGSRRKGREGGIKIGKRDGREEVSERERKGIKLRREERKEKKGNHDKYRNKGEERGGGG